MPNPPNQDFFRRIDESDDELFYGYPRLVTHIDDAAIAKVGEIFLERLPRDGAILDLMSSWRSHVPPALNPRQVIGVGLNRTEMEENPALEGLIVHNVNREPRLPLADAGFDGAVMTVSVQYLTRPIEVFADVGRVLRPGAPFIVTFSNRMFPTKAVALWRATDDAQHALVVARYFTESARFERLETIDRSAPTDPPGDPIWAVVGYRRAD